MKYFQQEIECMPREELRALQNERFLKQVAHVWNDLPYYRKKMEDAGVSLSDIKSLDDIGKLPFLSKEDLRDTYPDGMLAVPKGKVARIHSTSGTTGKRVIAFYTQHDLDFWRDCLARAFVAAGCSSEDICQVAYGYGLFTGGIGIHDGSERLGCMTIPMSTGSTERQLQFMQDLGTTVLCCTPSYAAYLGECVKDQDLKDSLSLRVGIFGAEAWSEEMRQDIQRLLGIKAFDIYGLTELSGPGVAFECEEQNGMHINEDHFYVETVDPDTGEVLPEGSQGELVFTALDKEAFPVIRYRTHDIGVLSREKCSCGRTLVKMCKPMGRSDDMLIVKGVNVFPSQIETVLLNQGYPANYQIVVDRVNHNDTIDILVEMTPEKFTDSVSVIGQMERSLVEELKGMLGIVTKVRLVAPKTLARSEGKAVRIVDKRKI